MEWGPCLRGEGLMELPVEVKISHAWIVAILGIIRKNPLQYLVFVMPFHSGVAF